MVNFDPNYPIHTIPEEDPNHQDQEPKKPNSSSQNPSHTPNTPAVIDSISEHVSGRQWVPGDVSGIEPIPINTIEPNHICPPNGFCENHPPALTHEQFEMDNKRRRFPAIHVPICRHNVKKCMQSYKSLPSRTRQSLRIAGILLLSAVAIVSGFYLARLGEDAGSFSVEKVVIKEKDHIQISLKQPSFLPRDDDFNLKPPAGGTKEGDGFQVQYEIEKDEVQHGVRVPPKIIKDADGKAKEYEKSFPSVRVPGSGLPLQPHMSPTFNKGQALLELERMRKVRLNRIAKPEEISSVLNQVRRKVDSDRKLISDKELRYWEAGSEPLRVLLVSTWRSGSTFLASILNEHPGVFQHHEPLSYFGIRQIRSGKDAFQAQQLLHRLLDCNYDNVDTYLNYTKEKPLEMIGHNPVVWNLCKRNRAVCYNKDFLSEACKMFPIQLVKSVRMRLNITQLLLNDPKLRVKVIFLVRDPRGTMNSRISKVQWCNERQPDCSSPKILCQDLEGDLKVAKAFESLYPDRFLKVKYEDLSEEPDKVAGNIFAFLGLEYGDRIRDFVQSHTTNDKTAPWSISRKSADRIALWKKELKPEKVFEIQDVCKPVLEALKYDIIPKNS